jgi:hypothetical protein
MLALNRSLLNREYILMNVQLSGVAANILNKQPRTNDKGWSSGLGVVRGAYNSSP